MVVRGLRFQGDLSKKLVCFQFSWIQTYINDLQHALHIYELIMLAILDIFYLGWLFTESYGVRNSAGAYWKLNYTISEKKFPPFCADS